MINNLQQKKSQLSSLLNERVKAALVRARFTSVAEMDASSTFFFNLERSVAQHKQMTCLRLPDGKITNNITEMRRHAVDFYSCLYKADECDSDCAAQLCQDLPKIDCKSKTALEAKISFHELSDAVGQLKPCRSPGIDGLTSEFYKHFCKCIGMDFFGVFCESYRDGFLPTSCQRAVLSLLPKKGDLTLLKNWRPVALLTTEYKLLSKCIANRLKKYLHFIIHQDQTYCISK